MRALMLEALVRRSLVGLLPLLLAVFCATLARTETGHAAAGQAIYQDGVLLSGQPLRGLRDADLKVEGATAACVNCHRRSGLGMMEGQVTIPPISGLYLFHPRATNVDDLDLPFVEGMRADRDPYTDATLARAIREGIGVDGQALSYLMPRYALGDADMATLITYLKGLTRSPVPGVENGVVHFATIVTPDANPAQRQGMLNVLQQYFADKDAYARAQSPRLHSSRRMMFKVNSRWQLHVWELKGAPSTWEGQLQRDLAREPVFAAISGIGGATWAPVHHFCEESHLPCLFPNVQLPVVAERDFYSLYFSKGVLLEAELIAHRLAAVEPRPRRVIQVFRAGDVGESASRALAASLQRAGLEIIRRETPANGAVRALAAALRDVSAEDAVVLWLRPKDIAALAVVPARASTAYISGLMGGLGAAPLPSAWRTATRLAYPFDMPGQRIARVDYARGWFALRHIPVVDEQVQVDTYLACGLVSETLNHMVDSFFREYLVERVEDMLAHRILTGYYPRLALAPGQRFASKGGYLAKFAEPTGSRLVEDSDWIVP